MLGVEACPYCGGEVEVIKLAKKEKEKFQPYRIECRLCRALVARGQGFPIESKSQAKKRIDQYEKYIKDLNGRPNGNGYPASHNNRLSKYQNS